MHNAPCSCTIRAALADPDRRFPLGAGDFVRVNPNTGTAPIFRSRRDAELTTAIYSRLPGFGGPLLWRTREGMAGEIMSACLI